MTELNEIEMTVVNWFADGVKVLGMPRSLGEIYGLLFISKKALALDDFVEKLSLSKGSASQGLNMLHSLGAIKKTEQSANRKVHYEADTELKILVGGFIREQVRPHLESGRKKVKDLKNLMKTKVPSSDGDFYQNRIDKMDRWMDRGRIVAPMLQKLLGE